MRDLLLLRHAKSAWDVPDLDDHDRDLAPRGVAAAGLIGDLLARERLVPDLVLCSTALRARATLDFAAARWPARPPVRHLRTLYLAAPGRMLEIARRQDDTVARLMLVGHNPGMGTLALRLLPHDEDAAALGEKFPTGALARISFPAARWADVAFGTGELLAFHRPRDLDG
jgi:phosphohistidine phosphatase